MKACEVAKFLNSSPYVFENIGIGVKLNFELNGHEGEKEVLSVFRNRSGGGLDARCREDIFHFCWDRKTGTWLFKDKANVGAS